MRRLIINEEVKDAVARCLVHAMKYENFFTPGSGWIPGESPDHVVHIPDGNRCVFTYTLKDGSLFRQLSVSVDHPNLYPSPEATVVIARLFGFNGGRDGDLDMAKRIELDHWLVTTNKDEHSVLLTQEMKVGRA
jgi:hypothetical protein